MSVDMRSSQADLNNDYAIIYITVFKVANSLIATYLFSLCAFLYRHLRPYVFVPDPFSFQSVFSYILVSVLLS